MFENPIVKKQMDDLKKNKNQKEYIENSLNILDQKRDSINDALLQSEEKIDNHTKMIFSNMQKIEQEGTIGENTLNSKMIERRQRDVERIITEKEELNQEITNLDTAELGVDISKNNPHQQN